MTTGRTNNEFPTRSDLMDEVIEDNRTLELETRCILSDLVNTVTKEVNLQFKVHMDREACVSLIKDTR
jgi:hypothetical protein